MNKGDMTAEQRECLDMIASVFHGEHHAPQNVFAFGRGIRCSVASQKLSTFDFDYLTRLVVLAHDHCIRVEIISSGPGLIGIVLHKRQGRIGDIWSRHPTIEDAVVRVRENK